ncbi:MAG: VOC family protein [Bacillota bacterium]|nr:VOC family protein [Bacillota bacterium]
MKVKLDAVGLFVRDLKEMVGFYKDVIGFEIEWDGGPYAEFRHEGIRFMMYGRKDFELLTGKEFVYPSELNGTFELAIDFPLFSDVDKEFERLVSLGAKPVYYPKTEAWGMRSSYIADPDGNLIEIGSWGKGEKNV